MIQISLWGLKKPFSLSRWKGKKENVTFRESTKDGSYGYDVSKTTLHHWGTQSGAYFLWVQLMNILPLNCWWVDRTPKKVGSEVVDGCKSTGCFLSLKTLGDGKIIENLLQFLLKPLKFMGVDGKCRSRGIAVG